MRNQILIERLIKGDENAFKDLINENQDLVINTCFGFLHNYQDAQDVAQDVFIEVYKSIGKFRKEAKISTWLYRISVNKCLNFIRDNKKREWLTSIDTLFDEQTIINKNNDSPQEVLERGEKMKVLNAAIDKLRKNQRTAFILSKYEDLSYKEIADVLNVSVSSVESLLFRAKKKLQTLLIKYYKE